MSKLRFMSTLTLGSLLAVIFLMASGNLRTTVAAPKYEDLAVLTNVLHLVQQHYVDGIEEGTLVEGALKGMLDTLDPHTSYLSPDLYREVQLDTRGEFEGLGIEITKRDGYVTVVAPIDGTPASRAGIRARDQIVAVCPDTTEESCQSTQEMNLIEAVKLMRGKRGTTILIKVRRQGWQQPKPFTLRRDSIKVSSVTMQMIAPGLPYVRMSQFQERTADDLKRVIDEAKEHGGPLKGLVLDLRDNPGGLLDQAVRVADRFIEDGMIVYSEGRGGGNRMEWHAKTEGTEPEYAVVVLVNGGSASASEIVAGSLQDHKRGLVIGTETFGKGSVQTIIPLENEGGLRLTTALYYLPTGRSIQEVRIQPDVVVEPYSEAEIKTLDEVEEKPTFGEEHLEGHIQTKKKSSPTDDRREAFERQLKIDRQLTRAIDLLKSWNIFSKLQPADVAQPAPAPSAPSAP
jgi:carboxyl-terminal processing protease